MGCNLSGTASVYYHPSQSFETGVFYFNFVPEGTAEKEIDIYANQHRKRTIKRDCRAN